MVKFESNLLRIEYAAMSQITTALGGSMRLVTLVDDQEKETRHPIPFAVARAWKEEYKETKFMVPVPVAVVYYGDMVVMVERGPKLPTYMLDDPDTYGSLFGDKPFTAYVEQSVEHIKKTVDEHWYTDGYSLYRMPADLKQAYATRAMSLTADGVFRSLDVDIIKFSEMRLLSNVENPTTHSVVCIANKAGDVFVTPPIFKNIAEMRNSTITVKKAKKGEIKTDEELYRFDLINKNFQVNLEFALAAGNTVGDIFGYKAVGPLHLEKLMVALTTVNLPKIKQSVRSTFPMGMTFLQAYAWLTGMMSTVTDLSDMIRMRALMKQLCQKGIFKRNTIERVFRKNDHGKVEFKKPEMVSREELTAYVANQSELEKRITLDRVLREKKTKAKSENTGMDISE